MIREAVERLANGQWLSYQEAYEAMREIMSGTATQAQIGAFLTALRMKGETVDEITAFAAAMRSLCKRINPKVRGRLVDTVGTGGDKIKTFNVNTTAAFIVAGAGVPVAKHGNRSVTSRSGSADVLESLGLNLNITPETVERTIETIGIGFMFAPAFHSVMKHAAGPRRELGIRTVFNVLGPLTNPASAKAQVVGVYDASIVEKIAHVLGNLGVEEAMVVHGLDGLDEISVIGETLTAWLRNGENKIFKIKPRDLGLRKASVNDIAGTSAVESALILFKILYGLVKQGDAKRDMAVANAAAGIIVGGKADHFAYAVELAQESIESGNAYKKLKMLIGFYEGSLPSKIEELEAKYG